MKTGKFITEKNRRYLKQSDYVKKLNKKSDCCNDYKHAVNLSSVNLNETEIKLLSKGLSFCPTPHKSDWIKLKTDLSDFARHLRLKADFLSWQKLLATIFFQKKSVK